MPRKEQGWITFQASEEERKILEDYCQQSQRTKTEILRELLRSLNQDSAVAKPLPSRGTPEIELENQKSKFNGMKVSARNVLKGRVKRVIPGMVNSEVTLEIVHRVELTSIITRSSAEELELAAGTEAYAVIKSSDVVIARD
jgi:molybdopterin-binding protein